MQENRVLITFALLAALLWMRKDGPAPTVLPTNLVVTYVYEKDDTAPTSGVYSALSRLYYEKKIPATLFEEDTVDGDGDVPDQYKLPLAEAQKAGLPALVVVAGDKVFRVVKNPTTAEQVMGAVE